MTASSAGGLQAAMVAMAAEARRGYEERLAREEIRSLIRTTDRMIAELEDLNLRGVSRVPAGWQPRLVALFASLPFEAQVPIPARPSPTQLLDILFEIQQPLFNRKNDLWAEQSLFAESA